MNSSINSSGSSCPVPPEQRPINEYQALQDSCFFRWAVADLGSYRRTLLKLWGLSWLLTAPVTAASFAPEDAPLQFLLMAATGATFCLSLILLRLYLGWSYICDRLLRKMVLYEETGWYDGQCWLKPPAERLQDQLIGTYQVQPILRRISQTFAVLGCLLVAEGLLWIAL